ncbi:hypothetical protein [Streptomyces sp. NPDC001435]|uniref:hypothetical protein n=1 Tax=unclassified Streptomyces TaxID=2593676 RepID=UPI0036CBF342
MTSCTHAGCAGRLMVTGFCDTCGRKPGLIGELPPQPVPSDAGEPGQSGPEPPGQAPVHAVAGVGDLDRRGLVRAPYCSGHPQAYEEGTA